METEDFKELTKYVNIGTKTFVFKYHSESVLHFDVTCLFEF